MVVLVWVVVVVVEGGFGRERERNYFVNDVFSLVGSSPMMRILQREAKKAGQKKKNTNTISR